MKARDRQGFDVDKVLSELGLEVEVVTGVERYLRCPFHSDSDPSFSINSESGLWVCFAGCGQGNLQSFISQYLGISYLEACDWLKGYKEIVTPDRLRERLYKTDMSNTMIHKGESSYWSEGMLRPYYNGKMSSYIFKRGFSKEILKDFGIGYDLQTKDIVIPARFENGQLAGIIRRSTVEGRNRYTNSPGFNKKSLLFGLSRLKIKGAATDKVYVVEGPLDTIWASQAGLPTVGLLGSDITERQAQLLINNFRTVVFMLDNDGAGTRGLEIARKRLRNKVVLMKGVIPECYGDVQEMGLKEVRNIKAEWMKG